ncbi:conjugative transfer ATPase, partial [Xanthomonas vasicola pv. vasculorum]
VRPSARDTAFTEFYLRFFSHHLRAVAKPGGLFEDTVVTRLRWRGQTRRVRMVVYRRSIGQTSRRGQTPEQMLNIVCDRLCGGLANAGIEAWRMVAADIHDWLLRWFNPNPKLLGPGAEDRERFFALAR